MFVSDLNSDLTASRRPATNDRYWSTHCPSRPHRSDTDCRIAAERHWHVKHDLQNLFVAGDDCPDRFSISPCVRPEYKSSALEYALGPARLPN